jgi:hypothetical protein
MKKGLLMIAAVLLRSAVCEISQLRLQGPVQDAPSTDLVGPLLARNVAY